MKDHNKNIIKETAYHESGHAVIGYRFNIYGGILSIIPDKRRGTLGHIFQEEEWLINDENMDKAQVITLYAGFESERSFNPNADRSGSLGDNKSAAEIIANRLPGYTAKVLRAEAVKLVKDNWAQICAVADELERLGLIYDPTEYELIVDAIDEGKEWKYELQRYRKRWQHLRKPKK
jgi:ATP-dependent Zn protease